ncbi:MAG: PHP domain-containing protein [Negativicutes bacterium]|nr:PHP domain-containing protein [Negativicutes bacterium]
MRADLHIHTAASDGSWTASELILKLKTAAIKLFAVTDHDSTANLAETAALAKDAGLCFIPGVEVCSTLKGHTFHILGYGIDPEAPGLKRLLRHNTALMEEADQASIRKLIAAGFRIDYDEYLAYQHNPARGGWKSLSFLTDKGFCRDINDFFANLFTPERGICFPEFPAPGEVISVIKEAGGAPVLAHPGSDFHGPALEETLTFFAREEIAGIECFHPGHDEQTALRAAAWCRRRGLLITGGSDCHGGFVPERRLGIPFITAADLELGELRKFCTS